MPKQVPFEPLLFPTQAKWRHWLRREHKQQPGGVWLQLAKKGCYVSTVSYAEAVETALCFGWIDGQKKAYNHDFWLQRFLPRSKRSIWSVINREAALRLIESGAMQPAGAAAIEEAKRCGRWDTAYSSARHATVPSDLQQALNASPAALRSFQSLDKASRYTILWRIQTVKRAETRARTIAQFVTKLERG